MAIKREINLTIKKRQAVIDEVPLLYEGDGNIDFHITIHDSLFKIESKENEVIRILRSSTSYAEITLINPDNLANKIETSYIDNKLVLHIDKNYITKAGIYKAFIHLKDDETQAQITIPSFDIFEVLEFTYNDDKEEKQFLLTNDNSILTTKDGLKIEVSNASYVQSNESIRITDLDEVTAANDDDVLVLDTIDGTKKITVSNLALRGPKGDPGLSEEEREFLFTSVSNGKSAIASAITDKGINTLATDTFETMANNISNIKDTADILEGTCADWPNIETETLPNGTLKMLVSDESNSLVSFSAYSKASNIVVDWGDGSVSYNSSSSEYSHTYEKGSGTPCSEGYTTFVITIKNVDTIVFNSLSSTGLMPNILWMNSSVLDINGLSYIYKLRRAKLSNINTVFISNCHELKYLELAPINDTLSRFYVVSKALNTIASKSNIIKVTSELKLTGCYSLTTLPTIDVENLTSLSNAFQNCCSLKHIKLMNTHNIKDFLYTFNYCYALNYIENIDFSSAENLKYAFNSCECLNIPLNINGPVTTFSGNVSLKNLKSLVFSENATFSGTDSQIIQLTSSGLDSDALNDLFESLPIVTNKTIKISYSLGAETCDPSIATAKGWTVLV